VTTAERVRVWPWRHTQGERDPVTFQVLDVNDSAYSITGWTVDAKIKTRPKGTVLHTFGEDDIEISPDGFAVTLTIPAAVSSAWTWTTGYYRIKVIDPSDPDDPTVRRLLQGPFVTDPD
jgi:hypothetical protein